MHAALELSYCTLFLTAAPFFMSTTRTVSDWNMMTAGIGQVERGDFRLSQGCR
jgi:hypothetical protein